MDSATADRFRVQPWRIGAITLAISGLVATGCGETRPAGEKDPSYVSKIPKAKSCDVKPLDWPVDGEPGIDLTMSSDGEYIATAIADSNDFVMWHDGKPSVVTAAPDKWTVTLADVNSHGVVIGMRTSPDADSQAWRYEDGDLRELKAPGGMMVQDLAAINDEGTIVDSLPPGMDGSHDNEILTWSSGDTEASTMSLSTTSGDSGPAVGDLSNDGTVVGGQFDEVAKYEAGEEYYQARMWNAKGKATAIPLEDFDALVSNVAGDWVLAAQASTSYRWKHTTKSEPDELDDFTAASVDESGRAYGAIRTENDPVPAVYDQKPRELPVVADMKPHNQNTASDLDTVSAASVDGSVLAGNVKGNPVVWTCG